MKASRWQPARPPSAFYVMTSFHGLHVLIGVVWAAGVAVRGTAQLVLAKKLRRRGNLRPVLALCRRRVDHPVHADLLDLSGGDETMTETQEAKDLQAPHVKWTKYVTVAVVLAVITAIGDYGWRCWATSCRRVDHCSSDRVHAVQSRAGDALLHAPEVRDQVVFAGAGVSVVHGDGAVYYRARRRGELEHRLVRPSQPISIRSPIPATRGIGLLLLSRDKMIL